MKTSLGIFEHPPHEKRTPAWDDAGAQKNTENSDCGPKYTCGITERNPAERWFSALNAAAPDSSRFLAGPSRAQPTIPALPAIARSLLKQSVMGLLHVGLITSCDAEQLIAILCLEDA